MKTNFNVPPQIKMVTETLEGAGFEAYLVGGCVRDLVLGLQPKDWDATTNATPEQIQVLFPHTFYENDYGTVGVVNDDVAREIELLSVSQETHENTPQSVACATELGDVGTERVKEDPLPYFSGGVGWGHTVAKPQANPPLTRGMESSANQDIDKIESLKRLLVVEVTPYRTESAYSDKRRPDSVVFSQKLKDDLKRRDFTINALAYSVARETLIDEYGGLIYLEKRLIRAVGNPDERFGEDALRMLRAVRLASELDFGLDTETEASIASNSSHLKHISGERIRDELVKIVMSDMPMKGLIMAQKLGLNQFIIPELEEGIGCEQMATHAYDVWEHNLRSLEHAVKKNWPLHIRLAALLHDVGKPKTRRMGERKWTFYGHDVVGARMTKKIMERLRFDKNLSDTVVKLVRYHLFFSDTDSITLSAVRRMVANVGRDLIWDLMKLRVCDRIGTGRPKEQPFRLRKYQAMIEEVLRDPISPKMLKIDGKRVMDVARETPSRRIGWILHALLQEVLDDPGRNTAEYLEKRAIELAKLPEEELETFGEQGKEKKEEVEEAQIGDINKKYHVR
ncbi:MAG: hypothetical protein COV07_00230 [Candidatus Vogelbacteria bacterium CG10_big_fil_rev_8_21_14_0_10_45_14]|uniref:HD domain-containing protein n=1 Tax=Candidatus Vogelbacteria bacterium CG10_big_fil_rev_8_21_14_0_10_45_14 TaxID=1975042 RepID=A0A2H0RN92_9BACT|nr:MAG: hypothetical protein COV07_00230 [Candidatus Vogelbacteria bacterium CG10_big_fil_rev_8_21_14_0_10_45_14]